MSEVLMDTRIKYVKDSLGGELVTVSLDRKVSSVDIEIDKPEGVEAFCGSYRSKLFFMGAVFGKDINELPYETQWFALKHTDGSFTVYFSVCDKFRTSFYGKDGGIWISAITGSESVTDVGFNACYRIKGGNIYELLRRAAEGVAGVMEDCSLREDKPKPDFARYFGWCTWDSFYEKVTADDVVRGLDSFKKFGFVPRFVILDDGWQTVNSSHKERGKWTLSDFKPNKKFGHGLKGLVDKAKNEYGVKSFFVWHAIMGYWGGVDVDSPSMAEYSPRLSVAKHPDTYKMIDEKAWSYEQFPFGIIDVDKAYDFYNGYHSYLKGEGVDGVKIDVQYEAEGHSETFGGRANTVASVRRGLEASVVDNFNGEMINCMSCSNDIIYRTKRTNMMRSSNDFYPNEPDSHLLHIYDNAVNTMWMGQFTVCDWDMFQTTHEYGPFHAAARAISGGPIYVSDRVDEHNVRLIKKLVNGDGEILSPTEMAMPAEDCIFTSPLESKKPYKIFNKNKFGGVIGIFAFGKGETSVSPSCVDGFDSGTYACFSYKSRKTFTLDANQSVDVKVRAKGFDIITVSEIKDGFAPVGTVGKLNCGGSVESVDRRDSGAVVGLRSEGSFVFYSEKSVTSVKVNGRTAKFTADGDFYTVRCRACHSRVEIEF